MINEHVTWAVEKWVRSVRWYRLEGGPLEAHVYWEHNPPLLLFTLGGTREFDLFTANDEPTWKIPIYLYEIHQGNLRVGTDWYTLDNQEVVIDLRQCHKIEN